MSTQVKPHPPKGKAHGARHGKQNLSRRNLMSRESDAMEDDEMERNPSDFPFPTFQPTTEEINRRREATNAELAHLTSKTKSNPVVSFKRPDVQLSKPMWRSDKFVKQTYIPKLDMLSVKDELLKHPQTARGLDIREKNLQRQADALPPWLTSIKRVASGCPQAGLPVQYEETSAKALRADQRLENHKRKVKEAALLARKAKRRSPAVSSGSIVHSRGIGKPKTKQEEYNEILQLPEVQKQIKAQCLEPVRVLPDDVDPGSFRASISIAAVGNGNVENTKPLETKRKSIMISLPKIGVRMFEVNPRVLDELMAEASPSRAVSPTSPNTARF